jgi:hypothetical protein
VSFWAGVLQGCALLAELTERQSARRITVFPFALGERSWFLAHPLRYAADCAISCSGSRASPQHSERKPNDGASSRSVNRTSKAA